MPVTILKKEYRLVKAIVLFKKFLLYTNFIGWFNYQKSTESTDRIKNDADISRRVRAIDETRTCTTRIGKSI